MTEKPRFESLKKIESIEAGETYVHEHGLKYRVDSVGIDQSLDLEEELHDVTGYEEGTEPKPFDIKMHPQDELSDYVLYTQLEVGSYPAGKKWVRKKGNFLDHFFENNFD